MATLEQKFTSWRKMKAYNLKQNTMILSCLSTDKMPGCTQGKTE